MNKVNWMQAGGVPLRNDDWQFEADAVRTALKGLGSVLGLNALLSGCVPSPSGGGYVFTSGFVLINGEVCYVPAVTSPITFDEDGNYFQLVETDVSPEGDVVMEDGSNANIYKQRIAVIGYDPDTLPPNSISWLTAYNNRLNAKALAAVVNETILPQKGVFWKRLNAPLDITSGAVSFDNKNANFAVINTNNSTLQNINLSFSGGQQPCLFALKVAGTGYLRIAHGALKCNQQRDHFFNVGDVILFINDGLTPTDAIHLISEGGSDVWHYVGHPGEPSFYFGCDTNYTNRFRFRKDGNYIVLDGIVTKTSNGFSGQVVQIPYFSPVSAKHFLAVNINTDTPVSCLFTTNGLLHIRTSIALNESVSFSNVKLSLD